MGGGAVVVVERKIPGSRELNRVRWASLERLSGSGVLERGGGPRGGGAVAVVVGSGDFARTVADNVDFAAFSFSFSLESFRPLPIVHHFPSPFSSPLTLFVGSALVLEFIFVTSPREVGPQRTLSNAVLDFFFFTMTISPISGSSIGST